MTTTRSPQEAKYVARSCRQLLRPLVRLALWFGLKYQELDDVLREVFIEEAEAAWQKEHGKAPSASQISVTTGINRKEIKRISTIDLDQPRTRSLSGVVFASWLKEYFKQPELIRLPIQSNRGELSFEKLIEDTGNDVHLRSVLSELVRLGLVKESTGFVELSSQDYTPSKDTERIIDFVSENTYSHLSAGVSNITKQDLPFLEQAILATDYSRDACIAMQDVARNNWHEVRGRLLTALEEANPAITPVNPHRLRIGMYVHFEPM